MKKILIVCSLPIFTICYGQDWVANGSLNNGGNGNTFGTNNAYPINVFTNNNFLGQFTLNNALSTAWDVSGPFNPIGDGLRINPLSGTGFLDMFTGNQGTTHIKWGSSGSISGQNSRFEQYANGAGFYFDAVAGGVYKFARSGIVTGFIGTNNFWRIGQQNDGSNFNGARRLEVLDNQQQFRLTYAGPNIASGPATDFYSNSAGNLQIQPQGGRVGINANTNPTATVDVFGDARIRNVQEAVPDALFVGVHSSNNASNPQDLKVRRLDFTGNPTDVLLGDGTWGSLPPPTPPGPTIFANNGLTKLGNYIQLGEPYNVPKSVPLLNNREIFLDVYSLIFTGKGRIGIGQAFPEMPTEKLDVVGNARFRAVPQQGGQSLILGLQQGAGANDIELSRLAFPNDPTQVLLGNGTWGIAGGTSITANNGLRMSPTPNNIQLGQANTGIGTLMGGELIQNTEIPMNGFNLSLYGNGILGMDLFSIGQEAQNSVKSYVYNNIESNGIYSYLDADNIAFEQNSWGGRFRTAIYGNGFETLGLPGTVVGVLGEATSNFAAVGVFARGAGDAPTVAGVRSRADGNGSFNFGGHFTANGVSSNTNYGIFAQATGAAVDNYAGFFDGDVYIGGATVGPSDENLKNNITPLTNVMNLINQLEPKTFDYDLAGYPSMHLSNGLQYGLIAQDVELLIPAIVSDNVQPAVYDDLGNLIYAEIQFKGLEYEQLIPIMIKGMQEQDSRIDSLATINSTVTNYNDSLVQVVSDLNARLTLLENCLSNILPALCNANTMAVQSTPESIQEQLRAAINVNLSDRNAIVLNQNVPNPFAESTVIAFTIPATVQKAQIHFYDGTGKLINSVDIVERGNGQLNVFANDLSTGFYTYSLVADGQIVSTKRMMKQ